MLSRSLATLTPGPSPAIGRGGQAARSADWIPAYAGNDGRLRRRSADWIPAYAVRAAGSDGGAGTASSEVWI